MTKKIEYDISEKQNSNTDEYNYCIVIDDEDSLEFVFIPNEVFEEEKIEYYIENRNELLEKLYDWVSETTNSGDKELIKADIEYIQGLKDNYIFSSVSTNEYIAKSDNEEEFNKICEEILNLDEVKDFNK